MSDVFFLVLRRLRVPFILLTVVYAVATFGMTLIPGTDPDGNVWYMSFFHAFYFVSFMGTTIGFGEVPYAFSDAQRAWVLVCIYTSVIAWLYAIGNMLRLLQDVTFQQAIAEKNFQRNINRLDQPFYIICGYGETGTLINHGLSQLGIQTVIIDYNPERTSLLELEDLSYAPISLTADTTQPDTLISAGLNHPCCKGIIAVTENDHTNLQIAVSCKLLNKAVPVICRSEIKDEADNMASFGTNVIINPYDTFASRLNLLVHNPTLHKIQNWFINQQSAEHLSKRELPKGRWIICGFGRLGKAIESQLLKDGIEIIVVDPDPSASGAPEGAIIGRGTEAKTLEEAGIMEASVVIASSDDDANNLSVLITAKQLNNNIYTIGRVSKESNHSLFVKANCDYIMRRSQLVANATLTIISRPLVSKFIKYSSSLDNDSAQQLINDIYTLTKGRDPITIRIAIDEENAPAIVEYIQSQENCNTTPQSLTIGQLCNNDAINNSRCLPLMLQRGGISHLLPSEDTTLNIGDELLVCGNRKGLMLPQRLRENIELIDSLVNNNAHHIPLLRWLARRKLKQ